MVITPLLYWSKFCQHNIMMMKVYSKKGVLSHLSILVALASSENMNMFYYSVKQFVNI